METYPWAECKQGREERSLGRRLGSFYRCCFEPKIVMQDHGQAVLFDDSFYDMEKKENTKTSLQ